MDDDDDLGGGVPANMPDLAVLARFLEVIDLLTPHAVRTAVSLGLPRLIDGGVDNVAGLASETEVDADALASLLDHLCQRELTWRGPVCTTPYAPARPAIR